MKKNHFCLIAIVLILTLSFGFSSVFAAEGNKTGGFSIKEGSGAGILQEAEENQGDDLLAEEETKAGSFSVKSVPEDVYDDLPLFITYMDQGISGKSITWIQENLASLGYFDDEIDGVYDAETKEAVRNFQKDHGIDVDGVSGKQTYKRMAAVSFLMQDEEYAEISSRKAQLEDADSQAIDKDEAAQDSQSDTDKEIAELDEKLRKAEEENEPECIELSLFGSLRAFFNAEKYREEQDPDGTITPYIQRVKNYFDTYNSGKNYDVDYSVQYTTSQISSPSGYIMDANATYNRLIEALSNGDDGVVEAVWYKINIKYTAPAVTPAEETPSSSASESYTPSSTGDTYISISLADQYLWYYQDGALVLGTPVVTGMATDRKATPAGTYYIINHATGVVLSGTMDGESWNSYVNYWMAISYNGIGIHDAPWRTEYGGSIYTYDGSHGCINLPYAAAEQLYYSTWNGIPVYIY